MPALPRIPIPLRNYRAVCSCALNANDEFVILDSTGDLSGIFAALTFTGFGSGFDAIAIYDHAADLVKLKVINPGAPVPVPGAWVLLLTALGALRGVAGRRSGSRRPRHWSGAPAHAQ